MTFIISKSPSELLALSNCVIFHPDDLPSGCKYVILNESHVFTVKVSKDMSKRGEIGTSSLHRTWAQLSLGQKVSVVPYDPKNDSTIDMLDTLVIQVEFLKKNQTNSTPYDVDDLSMIFRTVYNEQIFTIGQMVAFDYHGINLLAKVLDMGPFSPRGVLSQKVTKLSWIKGADSNIRLTGGPAFQDQSNTIIRHGFKFEDLGIGGLDEEFMTLFRRCFASRLFRPSLVQEHGFSHIKGLILYGPPGTGKTLIARQLGKMLNAHEPKVVNGPEILNRYVGQSEENVRNLFKDAETEFKAKGNDSKLHVIILDELDAICKQRGSRDGGTGVGDTIVNQFLTKIDGVEQLNNVLLIGMTNRLDLIDEALMRPGSFEVQLEIGLPDEQGRLQILKIHTKQMKDNNHLGSDVDLQELARLTPNYTGAELAGLIRSASTFSFSRHIEIGNLAKKRDDESPLITTKEDFIKALDEVRPAFGASSGDMERLLKLGFVSWSLEIDKTLADIRLLVDALEKGPSYGCESKKSTKAHSNIGGISSVLLYGPPASGKSAIAAKIALESGFPFVRLVKSTMFSTMNETARIFAIRQIFSDAYKSPLSIIVIDRIESLIDYAPIGPRFLNSLLRAIIGFITEEPPKDHKLFVIVTTSEISFFQQMNFFSNFDSSFYIPTLSEPIHIMNVVRSIPEYASHVESLSFLEKTLAKSSWSIGIKNLYGLLYRALMIADPMERITLLINQLSHYDGYNGDKLGSGFADGNIGASGITYGRSVIH
jgi:vesicle-fusing ATPase